MFAVMFCAFVVGCVAVASYRLGVKRERARMLVVVEKRMEECTEKLDAAWVEEYLRADEYKHMLLSAAVAKYSVGDKVQFEFTSGARYDDKKGFVMDPVVDKVSYVLFPDLPEARIAGVWYDEVKGRVLYELLEVNQKTITLSDDKQVPFPARVVNVPEDCVIGLPVNSRDDMRAKLYLEWVDSVRSNR